MSSWHAEQAEDELRFAKSAWYFLSSNFVYTIILFVGVRLCRAAVYVVFLLVFLKTFFPADYDLAELVWQLSGHHFQ